MEPNPPPTGTRRDFLGRACAASGCAAGAFAAVPVVRYLLPLPSRRPRGPVDVGPVDLADGTAREVQVGSVKLLVVRFGGRVTAVRAKCTHLGCYVKWDDKAGQIRCPCHGATFRADGSEPTSPAPRRLDPLEVRAEGGRLIVVFPA